MVVSWMTKKDTNTSVVKYGTTRGNYQYRASGRSRTYHEEAGYTHDVTIPHLKPATKYYYVCGDAAGGFSGEYTFTTNVNANQSNPDNINLSVAMYGDMGVKNAPETVTQLNALLGKVDFYFHIGDISYADDYISYYYEEIWNEWFESMKHILPFTPYMVSPGNHEHSSGMPHLEYSEYFKVYNYRFKMPAKSDNNMWYSFDYGGIHFISMSTETDYTGAEFAVSFGNQMAWLTADLQAATANRDRVPWVVVTGHRPLYTSSTGAYANKYLKPLRDAVERLFHEHKVDLFVCGHVHNYERSYPIYEGNRTSTSYVNPSGLVHVIVGNAGCPEGVEKDFSKHQPEWSAYRYDESTGYGVLKVAGKSQMTWTFHSSVDGAVKDTFTITKN